MVKIGPPSPQVNTLDVDYTLAYADTSNETWQIINFFLEELKPVDTAGLEPEDRNCPICAEDFTIDFHRAVRLPCNHCFGEPCIKRWLSPYMPWSPRAGQIWRLSVNHPGANTCPSCRQIFFPMQRAIDCLPEIDTRIKLWDWAYAHAGIALSDREHRAREDLLRYIDGYFARGLDEYYPSDAARSGHRPWAHERLSIESSCLRSMNLTPVQEHLRQRLQDIARSFKSVDMRWLRTDAGTLFFQYEGILETGQHSESDEEIEAAEDSEQPIEGDSDEMRFFRALFR